MDHQPRHRASIQRKDRQVASIRDLHTHRHTPSYHLVRLFIHGHRLDRSSRPLKIPSTRFCNASFQLMPDYSQFRIAPLEQLEQLLVDAPRQCDSL